MATGATPTDAIAGEMAAVFAQAERELQTLIDDALSNGAVGTAAYRKAQQAAVVDVLGRVKDQLLPDDDQFEDVSARGPLLVRLIRAAFAWGLKLARGEADEHSTPRVLDAELSFGRPEEEKVAELIRQSRKDLADTLYRIGRRHDDIVRDIQLSAKAQSLAVGESTKKSAERYRALLDDAAERGQLTFVDDVRDAKHVRLLQLTDAKGKVRNYQLGKYSEMAMHTLGREVTTQAFYDDKLARNSPYVRITKHPHADEDWYAGHDVCAKFEGRVFSLTRAAAKPGIPYIRREDLPPYHPLCKHLAVSAATVRKRNPRDARDQAVV